jgi:hypothetical protein
MRPVTERFLAAVRGSHQMTIRVRAVRPGQYGIAPDGQELAVLTGDVRLDSGADVRGSVDATVKEPFPRAHENILTPYGNELFVERGIDYGDGVREWVSLGYFRIDDIQQREVPEGTLRISGRDRMATVIDSKLTTPRQYVPGTTFRSVFDDLIGELFPGVEITADFSLDDTIFTTPHVAEDDRYSFLLDLVAAYGKVFYFDHRGHLTIRTPPTPRLPVWVVHSGERGTLLSASRSITRDGVFNVIVARGEAVGEAEPVWGQAYDNDPSSPTYYFGPFGRVPRFYDSSFLRTPEQCVVAARTQLALTLGLPYTLDFDMVPNPALEPLDPVLFRYPDGRGEVHILDQITIPLDPQGSMPAKTRQTTFDPVEG